jgi:MFS family permease
MQWIAVGLATAAIALNYIDRSTLAVGNLTIRQEFGLNATAIGALQSAWSLTYALFQIPVGFLLDRLGPRFLVGLALVAWSAAQAAGGLAGSYTQLMWARITLGATESPPSRGRCALPATGFTSRIAGHPPGFIIPAAVSAPP